MLRMVNVPTQESFDDLAFAVTALAEKLNQAEGELEILKAKVATLETPLDPALKAAIVTIADYLKQQYT